MVPCNTVDHSFNTSHLFAGGGLPSMTKGSYYYYPGFQGAPARHFFFFCPLPAAVLVPPISQQTGLVGAQAFVHCTRPGLDSVRTQTGIVDIDLLMKKSPGPTREHKHTASLFHQGAGASLPLSCPGLIDWHGEASYFPGSLFRRGQGLKAGASHWASSHWAPWKEPSFLLQRSTGWALQAN